MSLKGSTKEAEGKSRQSYDTEAKGSEYFKKEMVSYVKCCRIAQGPPANKRRGWNLKPGLTI